MPTKRAPDVGDPAASFSFFPADCLFLADGLRRLTPPAQVTQTACKTSKTRAKPGTLHYFQLPFDRMLG